MYNMTMKQQEELEQDEASVLRAEIAQRQAELEVLEQDRASILRAEIAERQAELEGLEELEKSEKGGSSFWANIWANRWAVILYLIWLVLFCLTLGRWAWTMKYIPYGLLLVLLEFYIIVKLFTLWYPKWHEMITNINIWFF